MGGVRTRIVKCKAVHFKIRGLDGYLCHTEAVGILGLLLLQPGLPGQLPVLPGLLLPVEGLQVQPGGAGGGRGPPVVVAVLQPVCRRELGGPLRPNLETRPIISIFDKWIVTIALLVECPNQFGPIVL